MNKVYSYNSVWKWHPSLLLMSGLIVITLLTGSILVSFTTSATSDSVVDEINITVPVSCSLTGTGMNTHNATIPNGIYSGTYTDPDTSTSYANGIGTTTLKVFCNDNNGFAIYAAGYTGNEIGDTNSNKLVGTSASSNATIVTGLATTAGNPDVSNWAMKLTLGTDSGDTTGTNALTIDSAPNEVNGSDASFSQYHIVPNEYTKVAHKNSATDMDETNGGVTLTSTYAAYISKTQPADTYSGQVIYTLVHPNNEIPPQPVACTAGKICYNPNSNLVVGTMAQQSAGNNSSVALHPSNFSRNGYGFAGWSDVYDYDVNQNAHFYGPMENITTPSDTTTNGLSLYAVWIPSEGTLQDSSKISTLCGTGAGSLTQDPTDGTADLSSVTALTDQRDNQAYAIAKLADGNCWMIENLRLDNTASHNDDGLLSQGYGGVFAGLASPETANFTSSTTPNSLYSTDGSTAITISGGSYRFPRYSNVNTASRAEYSDGIVMNTFSYGNYYTWASAIADTSSYGDRDSTTTSICPKGWMLPIGRQTAVSKSFSALSIALGGPSSGGDATSNTTPTGAVMMRRFKKFPNNFVFAGRYSDSSPTEGGSFGYYWSNIAYSNSAANVFYFNNGTVRPGTGSATNSSGLSVKCVADNT